MHNLDWFRQNIREFEHRIFSKIGDRVHWHSLMAHNSGIHQPNFVNFSVYTPLKLVYSHTKFGRIWPNHVWVTWHEWKDSKKSSKRFWNFFEIFSLRMVTNDTCIFSPYLQESKYVTRSELGRSISKLGKKFQTLKFNISQLVRDFPDFFWRTYSHNLVL